MRTTVDIETPLLKRVRAEALRRGVSFKDFLQGLIRRGSRTCPQSAPHIVFRHAPWELRSPHVRLDKALALAATLEDDEVARELTRRK